MVGRSRMSWFWRLSYRADSEAATARYGLVPAWRPITHRWGLISRIGDAMAGSTVHTCDHDPLVLLPEAVAFQVDVRRVDILKIGRSCVLVPQGGRRDNFFLNWPRVSDDCMIERNQPDAQDWRPIWSPIDRLGATDAVIASAAKQARIAPCSGSARCTWSLRCTRDDCAGRSAQIHSADAT